ncbi:MAG TPA: hypothetical protein EYQ67_10450 [Dehalococcoidia bacterium]|jgi:hypothetical protein|nr:hypothetical protein [Dehalococcoidia bacterium]
MENNKWERRLDVYLDSLASPLEWIPSAKYNWGAVPAILISPFATLAFVTKVALTFPWGLFLAAGRFLER